MSDESDEGYRVVDAMTIGRLIESNKFLCREVAELKSDINTRLDGIELAIGKDVDGVKVDLLACKADLSASKELRRTLEQRVTVLEVKQNERILREKEKEQTHNWKTDLDWRLITTVIGWGVIISIAIFNHWF